jgi:hypothetical protein
VYLNDYIAFSDHSLPLKSPCLVELPDHSSFLPLLNPRSLYHYRMDKISSTTWVISSRLW